MTADLYTLFLRLTQPETQHNLSAVRVTSRERVWIAKDVTGQPLLLVESVGQADRAHGLSLRNVELEPVRACSILLSSGDVVDFQAAILRCLAPEPELRQYFFRVCSIVLDEVGSKPSASELLSALGRMVELFRALNSQPTKSLQGLWCELFLLSRAKNIAEAVLAWQPTTSSLIDFVADIEGVEVKSTSGVVRRHRFKLEQLQPTVNQHWFVASLLIAVNARGTALTELWDRVDKRLVHAPALRARVGANIAHALGDHLRFAQSYRVDERAAQQSLRIYRVSDIPKINPPFPSQISDVEFSVDISAILEAPRDSYLHCERLCKNLFD